MVYNWEMNFSNDVVHQTTVIASTSNPTIWFADWTWKSLPTALTTFSTSRCTAVSLYNSSYTALPLQMAFTNNFWHRTGKLIMEPETAPFLPLIFKTTSLYPFSEYLFCTISFLIISFPSVGPQESVDKFPLQVNFQILYFNGAAIYSQRTDEIFSIW